MNEKIFNFDARHSGSARRTFSSSQLLQLILAVIFGWFLHSTTSNLAVRQEIKSPVVDSIYSFRDFLDSFDFDFSSPNPTSKIKVPVCNHQPEPLFPALDWNPHLNQSYLDQAAERLGAAVRIPTQSYDDMGLPGEDERYFPLKDFHSFLESTYPLIHSKANLVKINIYGLLYTFQGSDSTLKPAILAAHQDVVPATDESWTYPPFSGYYDKETGLVWGRGSSDDKSMLIAIMNAFERLLEEGFENQRTFILAFGFDEEISGPQGAQKMGEYLEEQFGQDAFEYIIDEGGLGIETVQDSKVDVAMPGVGEKGYSDVILTLTAKGGHSSMPPEHTAIGMLGSILSFLEFHPHRPSLSPRNPVLTHLICLADALDEIEKEGSDITIINKGRKDWNLFSSGDDHRSDVIQVPSKSEGFKMTKQMRKDLRNPSKWDSVAIEIAESGTRAEKFIIQTSQAIDVMNGGTKANALPEKVTALINHRINVDSSISDTHQRLENLIRTASKKFGLKVVGFGQEDVDDEMIEREGFNGILRLTHGRTSEPTPVSPITSAQFSLLASTIKAIFPPSNSSIRWVSGVVMTGNTDVRYYSFRNLSRNIWRFNPNRYSTKSAKHAVNENMDITAHVESARFIWALVRNSDGKLD